MSQIKLYLYLSQKKDRFFDTLFSRLDIGITY